MLGTWNMNEIYWQALVRLWTPNCLLSSALPTLHSQGLQESNYSHSPLLKLNLTNISLPREEDRAKLSAACSSTYRLL